MNWLQAFLFEAVEKKLCTKIHCTTCGATDFRRGVLAALACARGQLPSYRLGQEDAFYIIKALAEVVTAQDTSTALKEPVRCLLFDLWYSIPLHHNEMETLLARSWAGDVLQEMKAHYAARQSIRRAQKEFQDPANVRKRREEKRRLKQEQHAKRLLLKKEKDRIWWETHRSTA